MRGCAEAAYPWHVAAVEVHRGLDLHETEPVLKQSTYVDIQAIDLALPENDVGRSNL